MRCLNLDFKEKKCLYKRRRFCYDVTRIKGCVRYETIRL